MDKKLLTPIKNVRAIQHKKILAAMKMWDVAYMERKRKYDKVMSLQINDGTKLTGAQLQ